MKGNTSQKILDFIEDKGQATGNDLTGYLSITSRAVRKQLNKLLSEGKLYKVGKPPKVFYLLSKQKSIANKYDIEPSLKKSIDDNFLVITPSGERLEGSQGFIYWCNKQKLGVEKTALEYGRTLKKYIPYKKNGLIDGMYKLKNTFDKIYLDKIFYLDFYSIERFGKTKLGQLLLYAKQSQDKSLIKELASQIRPKVESLIESFDVDAVGFIPPTVKREIQFMQELERNLNLSLPSLKIVKVKTPIIVPQKTLNKLADRIENARDTIMVNDARQYKTLLLLDDALGSGATLNETAKKIKKQKLAENIIGLAITGSFSGFEVISEV
ncbi:MAG: hypothetical protein A3B86_03905 [Candidatus Yanofskybacteria bacterium RIFCSPHIGHO2_02_FULL_38_22b]|uniref:Uncharacterized protein n=1 Tax=Candidatus Yanofskybacteria bacterium RIFCSPHIGHO2_02_FULL_38_22b TaxID=1802673 RepID=A0A1F8EZE8_9BACT|nr:MAG: hypothetical protein A2816_01675 [Candidatus Yanofskybacteria bacterium RIFCSPHIGHO2_01_FULL_39_44]OGN06235.1 MAG: hypothetical protein A3B86_03905 [Candidatus Yanofskybacteria bacterium RIFCSPHIGHO2_02_FULL_38_22b]OGN19655.1 MAG: hypothetical protein A2910_03640 [Candidatus Yanofskybacteria bacterium RIFCSPLOWO2_01_FULL_39_28]